MNIILYFWINKFKVIKIVNTNPVKRLCEKKPQNSPNKQQNNTQYNSNQFTYEHYFVFWEKKN